MKKLIALLLVLAFAFCCVAETTTTEDDTTSTSVDVNLKVMYANVAAGLNMRAEASYQSQKLITLWLGEPVYVLETVNEFSHIVCAYGEGYVSTSGLSANRSKNMEIYRHMYVNMKTAGELLNVRSVPYLPAEYANEPIDTLKNGTQVTAINQYGSFVEIIYYKDNVRCTGFVAESCLATSTDPSVYKDEVCAICGGKLDGRCHIIADEVEPYLVCAKCYTIGVCTVCGKYVYFDQYYALNGNRPTHSWCLKSAVDTLYHNGRPVNSVAE